VGHPLLDHVSDWSPRKKIEGDPLIGLLPGSREQEIRRILPPMIETAKGIRERHPRAKFAAACVDSEREKQIQTLTGGFPIETHVGGMYDVLGPARFCMVASGTATVEAALFGVPFVILYRVTPVTYWMARMLVDIEHIGMVNILAGKRLVPEFVQGRATAREILPAALTLIDDSPERGSMIDGLAAVREILGGPGASERAAREIITVLNR
jgi:lipid-A-disaccharide synthase